MALVMLGTFFLVKQQKAGRQLNAEELADIINSRHDLRQKAKESHAKRSQVALE